MLVVADNDVRGAVAAIRQVLESREWREFAEAIELRFVEFEAVGLARDATDEMVWTTCQYFGAVLLTGNRAGGLNSLDSVIRELGTHDSLPVVTIGDPQGPVRDRAYAKAAAIALLDFLERIESLRGVGRLFVP